MSYTQQQSLNYIRHTCNDVDDEFDTFLNIVGKSVDAYYQQIESHSHNNCVHMWLPAVEKIFIGINAELERYGTVMIGKVKDVGTIPMRDAFDKAMQDKDFELEQLRDDYEDKLRDKDKEIDKLEDRVWELEQELKQLRELAA